MAVETKTIPTYTTSSVIGSLITITTTYFDSSLTSGVISAFISGTVQTVETVGFIEGEGGIKQDPSSLMSFYLDSNGNLIASGPDAANFNVDSLTGQLQFTT